MSPWRFVLPVVLASGCTQPTEEHQPPCPPESCAGHGQCVVEDGEPRCDCDAHYVSVGLTCRVNCLEIGCSGRGGCVSVQNEGKCVCDQGYYAPGPEKLTCQANLPETCDGEDCSGHGVCVDTEEPGKPVLCICERGWLPFGLSCVEASCRGVECSGHGTCVEVDGSPLCRCDHGFEPVGLGCVPADCSLTDCSGHGACVDEGGQARCVCDHGYVPVGLECRPQACASEDCSGHGVCVDNGGLLRCVCDPGYKADGLSCRPGCAELDCSGHGACVQSDGTLRCVCDPGYQPWGASCVALAQGGDGGATGDGVDSGQSTDGGVDDSGDVDGSVDRDSGGGDAVPPTVPGTWVLIDASGTPFTMGSPLDELGRYSNEVEHDVTLTRNYWMMTTEVTQQQFLDQMGYNPSFYSLDGAGPDCGLDCPVEQVNWHEVAAYANGLSRWEGLAECYSCTGTAPDTIDCRPSGSYATAYECPGYRLPTEAEWEYAARGGTTTATYAGDLTATSCFDATLIPIAWFCGNAGRTTHPVGTRSPNAYELYDMLGNVGEWCHDWHDAYPGGPEVDPPGAASGMSRVRRGSSCDGTGEFSRAAYRGYGPPDNRAMQNGVRLVRSSP